MAEERQAVAQGSSPLRFCEAEMVRRVVRVRSWSFMVVVVVIGTIGDCGVILFVVSLRGW
jgi:hypothetical protein